MPRRVMTVLLAARKASWGRVLATIVWLRDKGQLYWQQLTPDERSELLHLARKSRGRKANLTKQEQKRLASLLKETWYRAADSRQGHSQRVGREAPISHAT